MPASAEPEKPPRSKFARRTAALALGFVTTLALLEIGTRVVLAVRGTGYDADATERATATLVNAMNESARTQGQHEGEAEANEPGPTSVLMLHPYLGFSWSRMTGVFERETAYFDTPESTESFEVLIVGGSVAARLGNYDRQRIEAALAADPLLRGRRVIVSTHAVGGYKQPQQALLVAYLFSLGHRPDAVVNVDGFNECALASANIEFKASPVHPSVTHWGHLASGPNLDREALDLIAGMRNAGNAAAALLARARERYLFASAFAGELVWLRVRAHHDRYTQCYTEYSGHVARADNLTVLGPTPPRVWENAMERAYIDWDESSRSIDAMCRARSIPYLHVLQPTLYDEGSKSLTPEELAGAGAPPSWIRGARVGYPELRKRGAALSASGIAFVDGSQLFREVAERVYIDACHYDQEGIDMLADLVAREILVRIGKSTKDG